MEIIPTKKVLLSWLGVVLCSITIFLIVPVALTIQKFVAKNFGKNTFIYFVLSIVAFVFLSLLYLLIFNLKVRSFSNYIWLFILAGLYFYFTLKLVKAPAEAIHFLEYGMLGFFLFRALKYHIKDKSIYLTGVLFCLLVGTFDEILQWVTPGRLWSFRDVGLNTLSGGLFQAALWKVVKPKIISEKISIKSIRIITSIFAVCLIVLGLCASNTPDRVAYYTNLISPLSFLQKEEPMSEFGYKLIDVDIGVFYSRFAPDKLEKTDNQQGEKYAQILNKSVNISYKEISNPFLYELRIHVFRRDTYFDRGNKTSDLNEKKEFYSIAYKENLILEKYFRQSIKKSIYAWGENSIKETEPLIDKRKPYKSPVSANLFTSFSEKTIWISILVLLSFLILINLILYFLKKQNSEIIP
jgi:VanZ family protein